MIAAISSDALDCLRLRIEERSALALAGAYADRLERILDRIDCELAARMEAL